MDTGRNRLCDYVEISKLYLQGDNSVGEFYSIAITNNHQKADTEQK